MSQKWLLSATQIETFSLCQRKWGYQYLDGIKPLASKAALFGSSVHTFLQKYLTGYEIDFNTDEGRVIKPGLDFLPKKLDPQMVEKQFFFAINKQIFQGFIDFFHHLGSQTWLIGDHKTCSSFTSALTSEQLKKNIQANIYAQWAFNELGAEKVQLKWIYYKTKGPAKAICVEAQIKKQEQPKLFKTHLHAARDITAIIEKKTDSLKLEKNFNACFKYGRCPFFSYCKLNQKPFELTKGNVMPEINNNINIDHNNNFHLYIDCAPVKTDKKYKKTIEISDLLKPILEQIKTEKDLSHYRLAGYGQHVGLIANYLEKHLSEKHYDSTTAILSSLKTPEGMDTLQTLSAAASLVIRGF